MPEKRVLIVDDDEALLRTLERLVSSEGYEVIACSRFEEAKQYLTRETPDVLVTDVRLGLFNGLQLVFLLREEHPDLPMIVLSAWDDPTLRKEAEKCGARYLVKPVTKQELLQSLAEAPEVGREELIN